MPVTQAYIRSVKFEEFDPNEPSAEQPLWAVFDGYHFKTFSVRGHAMNSFHHKGQAKLYSFVDGRWVEHATKAPYDRRPQDCQTCRAPLLQKASYGGGRPHNPGRYIFDRHCGKLATPLTLLFVCPPCHRTIEQR